LVESAVTFWLVHTVATWWGVAPGVAPILAALSISASPAGIVRVVNELRSAGQVTERVMHLCAINCLVSVLVLKLVIAQWTLSQTADIWPALAGSVHVVFTSVLAGGALGVAVPWLLRWRRANERGVTLVYALAVLLLTTLSFGLQFSPLLAALTFGVVARERRVLLTSAQRDFGTVGDLLTLFLFVYIASLMEWSQVWGGVGLAVVVIAARTASKVTCNALAARVSGITWRKGVLTGLALTPMSVFAIVLLEHSRTQGFGLANEVLAAMTAMMVLQELFGPVVTQRALMAARETHVTQETRHGA
jgi:Kef-type K+ transport system membrane component KefB